MKTRKNITIHTISFMLRDLYNGHEGWIQDELLEFSINQLTKLDKILDDKKSSLYKDDLKLKLKSMIIQTKRNIILNELIKNK